MDRTSSSLHPALDDREISLPISISPDVERIIESDIERNILSEAEHGLNWLQRRAELIRLEIQAIELELAIQHAHAGESAPLIAWLQKNGTPWQEPLTNQPHPTPAASSPISHENREVVKPTSSPPTTPDNPIAPTPKSDSTSSVSPTASPKPRSQKRPYLTPSSHPSPASSDSLPKQTDTLPNVTANAVPKPTQSPAKLSDTPAVASAAKPKANVATQNARTNKKKTSPPHPQAALKSNVARIPHTGDQTKPDTSTSTWSKLKQTPPWMISTAVHLALLVVLMLFTIPLPEPKENLGLTGTFAPLNAAPLKLENTTSTAEQELMSTDLTEPTNESAALENALEKSLPTAADIAGNIPSTAGLAESLSSLPASGTGEAGEVLDGQFMDTLLNAQSLASANFFGLEATGNIFCFVVDCSGSMRGEPFAATKQELLKTISQLKPNQRFCVFFFSQKLFPMMLEDPLAPVATPAEEEFRPAAVYATPENLIRLQRWMDTVPIGTGGPPNQALKMAIQLEPDSIFLLTDGVTRSDVAGNLIKTNRQEDELDGPQIRCPIHTIGFYSREGEALLQRIATENGGQYRHVPNPQPSKKSKKMEGGS